MVVAYSFSIPFPTFREILHKELVGRVTMGLEESSFKEDASWSMYILKEIQNSLFHYYDCVEEGHTIVRTKESESE